MPSQQRCSHLPIDCITRLPLLIIGMLAFAGTTTWAGEIAVFVSPSGDDSADGTIAHPMRTIQAAVNHVRKQRTAGTIPPRTSVHIWLRQGRYPVESTVQLNEKDSGTADHPLVIAPMETELVVFDGRKVIDRRRFQMVKQPDLLKRLARRGRGKIAVATIPQGPLADQLGEPKTQISYGSEMLQTARFPDRGFVLVDRFFQKDSGKNQVGTSNSPVGATLGFSPSIPRRWADEVARSPKARLTGYISASWLKSSFVIHSMSRETGAIRLRDASAYGLPHKGHLCRAYLEHVLPALDRPGEWHFDSKTRQLFIWPPRGLKKGETIGIWAGKTVFNLQQTAHVRIERLVIENLGGLPNGSAGINISGGHDNQIAGSTFRHISSPTTAFNIGKGSNHRATSCNIYDVEFASRLSGGSYDADQVSLGNNAIENCHFTQVHSTDFYGKVCGIGGAGNHFRHNLVHNHNGQIVTISGVDHLIEKNEVFNTGIEEGDGGAFYQGAMLHSWGNRFRHNFFHHIMCVPKIFTRAAIFSDDGDSGDIVEGNVFYKAGEGFKTNTGMGHVVTGNLTIGGIHAFLVQEGRPEEGYTSSAKIFDDDPASGAKGNLFGKTLSAFGTGNWKTEANSANWLQFVSPVFLERYPSFEKIVKRRQKEKKLLPINEFKNNHAIGFGDRNPYAIPGYSVRSGNTRAESLSAFRSPARLNFSYKKQRPDGAPDIPFDEIGLYRDEYRDRPPHKDFYRAQVRRYWQGQRSAAPREYDPAAVNRRSYFNTGQLVKNYLE